MPHRAKSNRQHEPASTSTQRDSVPSKALPPLSSMDRMTNGRHLGQCPTCGEHRWWDNRARKTAGEFGPERPDYACANCRHGRWDDGRDQPGKSTGRVTAPVKVVAVPSEHRDVAPGGLCGALKRDGSPCRNGAMAGSPFCGPHASQNVTAKPSNTCKGTTKSGKPCGAGAQRGHDYCPQHQPRS